MLRIWHHSFRGVAMAIIQCANHFRRWLEINAPFLGGWLQFVTISTIFSTWIRPDGTYEGRRKNCDVLPLSLPFQLTIPLQFIWWKQKRKFPIAGNSRCPWECDQKGLTSAYQKMIYLPKPDYSYRYDDAKNCHFLPTGQGYAPQIAIK